MFKLYPQEAHWWSFNDYGATLAAVEALEARSVLEFGPGSSTLALIEGGATTIDSCEDQADWAAVYRERLEGKYPGIVTIREYAPGDFAALERALGDRTYDLGLVDAPRDSGPNKTGREKAIDFCLARCRAVLIPAENGSLIEFIRRRADQLELDLDLQETGPLHGHFALLQPRQVGVDQVGPELGGAPPTIPPPAAGQGDPPLGGAPLEDPLAQALEDAGAVADAIDSGSLEQLADGLDCAPPTLEKGPVPEGDGTSPAAARKAAKKAAKKARTSKP